MFTNPTSLSLKYNQMVIKVKDSEQTVTRPIEDIGIVIIDNQMVQMTVPLINALADNNVAVVFCGSNSMPNKASTNSSVINNCFYSKNS